MKNTILLIILGLVNCLAADPGIAADPVIKPKAAVEIWEAYLPFQASAQAAQKAQEEMQAKKALLDAALARHSKKGYEIRIVGGKLVYAQKVGPAPQDKEPEKPAPKVP